MTKNTLTIGIVAGEISGDALGADFMRQMQRLHPQVRWVGVGGEKMRQAGLTSIIDMSRLSVMGLSEVVKHLPDLLRAKREILAEFDRQNIDIFVGIDAPDFNLRLGKALKPKGVFCVQMVSPSIWAWRENRIHGIKAATDLVLCLFPFELSVYAKHQHPAVCVGHPLLKKLTADHRAMSDRRSELIKALPQFDKLKQISAAQNLICLMSGSRSSEISAILPLLLDSAKKIHAKNVNCQFILPVVSADHAQLAAEFCRRYAAELCDTIHILYNDGKFSYNHDIGLSQACMNASDVVLLASGTATLECLLLERPMVVVYKVNHLTYVIAKRLIKIPFVSLPNILSNSQVGSAIVPELIQEAANGEAVSQHALAILKTPEAQIQKLAQTSDTLRSDSHANAAQTVLDQFLKTK